MQSCAPRLLHPPALLRLRQDRACRQYLGGPDSGGRRAVCGAAAVGNVLLAHGFERSLASRLTGATVRKGGLTHQGPQGVGAAKGWSPV